MTDAMDWLRPILSALVGVAVVALFTYLARRPRPEADGWHHLTPSAMHWGGAVLGTGLSLLFLYVRLFVGSARADAASQMTILTGLILAFAAMTLVTFWSILRIRRQAMRWRGLQLVWRDKAGIQQHATLNDVSRVTGDLLGYTVLRFIDGSRLKIDTYAQGAGQLIDVAARAAARTQQKAE